jgi:hypothetical protein
MTVHPELIARVDVEGARYPSLMGKGIIITGGGSGIGASLVEHFRGSGLQGRLSSSWMPRGSRPECRRRSPQDGQPSVLQSCGSSRYRGVAAMHH